METLTIGLVILPISFYLLRRLLHFDRQSYPLPPGPQGIPFFGHFFKAPSFRQWETYSRWAHEYGDIVHISLFGQHIVILNNISHAKGMLEHKGSIYSERGISPMVKISGWGDVMTFLDTGDFLREQRAYVHKVLGTSTALRELGDFVEENQRFLRRVLESPEELGDHVRHNAGSIVLKIAYGYTAKESNDPFVFNAERSFSEFNLSSAPATWLVDFFPILEKLPSWFPGASFKRLGKQWRENMQELTNAPFQLVKNQMAAGVAVPSFVSTILGSDDPTPEDEHVLKWAAMAIYAGGSDTTVSSVLGFFLAMALHPHVLRKAQEEIDHVIGSNRFPSISDRNQLPYVDALVREVFRWIVVVPNGISHRSSQDDIHAGYFIPKGSLIIPNAHFMLNDPRTYKDPAVFNPERFLGANPERDPREIAFGFGRRLCPGRLLADEIVFVTCAMSIAVLDIQKKIKDGVVIEPVHRMTPGTISHPEPFEITIKSRSTQAASLVKA